MLRRAKNIKNASETERDWILEDAERLENRCVWLVIAGIALEAVIAAAPLIACHSSLSTGIGNTLADAAVALGVLGELRFGNVASAVLKIKLTEAIERASAAQLALETYKAPRQITPELEAAMVSILGEFAGQEFSAVPYQDVSDSAALGKQLSAVLVDAKWRNNGPLPHLAAGTAGVFVEFDDRGANTTRRAAEALALALTEGGIPTVARASKDEPIFWNERWRDTIIIGVGTKY